MKQLFTHKKIKKRIKSIAKDITSEYPADQPLVLIVVLNGAYMFASDLSKSIARDCYIEFVKVSSYHDSMESSNQIDLVLEFKTRPEYENAHFLIVEDIVDTGNTVTFLQEYLEKFNPRSIGVASLLWKNKGCKTPDFYCFEVDKNDFVIGRGLDYKGQYRSLLNIYKVTNIESL